MLLGRAGRIPACQGVTSAVSGYDGGDKRPRTIEWSERGTTGHAESVRVTFDPRQISYGRLLQIYFSVAHDPTQLNRQGPDAGTQYRSAIFVTSPEQEKISKAYIAQLDAAHAFPGPIATKIEPDRGFVAAEDYHQDFLTLNPDLPLHRVQRPPQGREPQEHVPRQLPRRTRACFRRPLLSIALLPKRLSRPRVPAFLCGMRVRGLA